MWEEQEVPLLPVRIKFGWTDRVFKGWVRWFFSRRAETGNIFGSGFMWICINSHMLESAAKGLSHPRRHSCRTPKDCGKLEDDKCIRSTPPPPHTAASFSSPFGTMLLKGFLQKFLLLLCYFFRAPPPPSWSHLPLRLTPPPPCWTLLSQHLLSCGAEQMAEHVADLKYIPPLGVVSIWPSSLL